MSLIEIGKKYPTSKNISGFIEIYEEYFKTLKDKNIWQMHSKTKHNVMSVHR